MKLNKIFAGLSAAAIALSCFAMSVSANSLYDYAYPSESDAEANDAFYSVGAMGYYMSQEWNWNQGDWIGINEEGQIVMEYKINKVLADTTLEGKGTLGDMGIMVCNLPEEGYPYDITIPEARFVAEDGTETVFESILSMTEATEDPESGFRIHIRPTDEVDEATGEVTKKACPEAAGWDEEGAFNGGVLYITVDFGMPPAVEAPEETEAPAESVAEEETEAAAEEAVEEAAESAEETEEEKAEEPASSAAEAKDDSEEEKDGLGAGAIAGICAGAAALIAIVIAVIVKKK